MRGHSPLNRDRDCKKKRGLTTTVLKTFGEFSRVREEWDRFVEHSGSDIYFTFDWLETWWKYYGHNRQPRLFFIRSHGRVVAALPFCIQKIHMAPIPIVLAKFIGADSVISVFNPAFERSCGNEIWSTVLNQLLVEDCVDAVSLSPLSGLSSVPDSVREVVRCMSGFRILRDDSPGPHSLHFLPESKDEFLCMLSPKARANNRRDWRRLRENATITCRMLSGEDAVDHFNDFVTLHQLQWEGIGKQGHFQDYPSSLDFNTEIISKLSSKSRVFIHEIVGDGELLSAEYGFIFGDKCYWRLAARRANAPQASYGLGRLSLVSTIEALIEKGVRLIEDGPGHYEYKLHHQATEFPVRRLVLARSSLTVCTKVILFLLTGDVIHLLYYRFWFMKLVPHIRRKARPLSQLWIMTRL
jgi:CelD/BcsL family acetyltransferase involved in cellulose biosynthesis